MCAAAASSSAAVAGLKIGLEDDVELCIQGAQLHFFSPFGLEFSRYEYVENVTAGEGGTVSHSWRVATRHLPVRTNDPRLVRIYRNIILPPTASTIQPKTTKGGIILSSCN